jgi:hypothetical protein
MIKKNKALSELKAYDSTLKVFEKISMVVNKIQSDN